MKIQFLKLSTLGFITLSLLSCKKETGPDLTGWTTYYSVNEVNQLYLNTRISAISKDINGTFWVATGGVVMNYNGTNWTIDTVTNNYLAFVSGIAIDSHGNKWFGINQSPPFKNYKAVNIGLVKYDGVKWTIYNTGNSGLASNLVNSVSLDTLDNLWIGTDQGVSTFDGTNWTTYNTGNGLKYNNVSSIEIDKFGNKWFGTNSLDADSGGVSVFNGATWTFYTMKDGLAGNLINTIAIDKQGNKWFGTNNGLTEFDGTHWTTYNTSNSGISGDAGADIVSSIAFDSNNNLWVGFEGGVTKFDGKSWVTYTQSNSGLNGFWVYSIFIDSQGNKWFGTNYGLCELL